MSLITTHLVLLPVGGLNIPSVTVHFSAIVQSKPLKFSELTRDLVIQHERKAAGREPEASKRDVIRYGSAQ